MSYIAGDVGNAIEQIRPWLTPAVLLAILGVVTRHYATIRKANTADLALAMSGESSALKTYADEVKALREERRLDQVSHHSEIEAIKDSHRADMESMESRHAECERARDDFRDKVDALRDLVTGLNRVIVQASVNKTIELGEYPSEEVRRSAERVDRLFKQRKEDGRTSR